LQIDSYVYRCAEPNLNLKTAAYPEPTVSSVCLTKQVKGHNTVFTQHDISIRQKQKWALGQYPV
jgi:hypothetical protein